MEENIQVSLTELSADGVTLKWNEVSGAHGYRALWTDRDTPAHIFKELPPVKQTTYRFRRSMDIPYYLKVQALSDSGEVLAESAQIMTPVGHIPRPQLEKLGRGLIAVCTSDGVCLSWRLLRDEVNGYTQTGLAGADFVVYKNKKAIAVVTDRTSYLDKDGTEDDFYAVAALYAGKEQPPCKEVKPWKHNYIDLPLTKPEDGVTPAGEKFTYRANDMSVGDVDGDGEYEFIVKWDPDNSKDVSQRGYTGRCIIDCYKLDGTLMWRLDMGPNIRAGAHYTQFMVYDFNGDGRAEMALKTAPGTKMTRYAADGTVLSEKYITMLKEDLDAGYSNDDNYVCSAEDYRKHLIEMFAGWQQHDEVKAGHWPQTLEECFGIPVRYSYPLSMQDAESLVDYFISEWAPKRDARNRLDEFEGFIYEGPEYLTMFDGLGQELDTIRYVPGRTDDGLLWGDYAWRRIEPCNRVDRFLAGVAYLDGERPYMVFCRGYYTRACVVAYSFFENRFKEEWRADSGFVRMDNPFNPQSHETMGTDPVYGDLAGQGNHSLSAADIDGDGCMEIIYGAAAIDHDGSLLYSARDKMPDGRIVKLGHGDAMHVADIDPDRPGKEIFNVFEEGSSVPYGYALRDAETGEAYFGEYYEGDLGRCMVGDIVDGVRGLQVWVNDVMDCKGNKLDVPAPSTNMRIYWSGDLTTQLTDGADYLGNAEKNNQIGRVCDLRRGVMLEPEGTMTNNGTKGNPCLVANIFGDYREQLLLRLEDSSAVRIYTSTDEAPHKLFTLMHDIQYRCGVAWQNNCYNQPVYPSFYYASDMDFKNVLPAQSAKPVLYLAGDSIMQSYDDDDDGLFGWGQMLAAEAVGGKLCVEEHRENCPFGQEKRYVLPELIVDNCAMGGRSLRTFADEGRLEDILGHLRLGDFVMIQFAHNDCNADCPERFETVEEYKSELKRYVSLVRGRGAEPILVTAVPLLDGVCALERFDEYVLAMKEAADSEGVVCLDLNGVMKSSISCLGDGRSREFYQADGVHLTKEGAAQAARIVGRLLKDNDDKRLELLRKVF